MPRLKLYLILCVFLTACQQQLIPPPATLTPTHTPPPTATSTATLTPEPSPTPTPAPPARRVLILSIDGLRPDAIALAPMPYLTSLFASSAWTLNAQTIFPSVTLPAHTSMLSGQCPNKHNVNWNDYMPELGYAQVTDLFDIAHAAGMQTAMFVGKEKLRQITEPTSTDIFQYINDRDLVIADTIIQNFPADFRLMFIHFPTPDGMGHEYGWLSGEQLSVIFRADQALEMLTTELQTRGLLAETLVIITADHGGHSTTHGSSMPEDMTIPWVAYGAGVQPVQLNSTITTTDTAATAAYALGLPIPAEWDGMPIYEAFGQPAIQTSKGCTK